MSAAVSIPTEADLAAAAKAARADFEGHVEAVAAALVVIAERMPELRAALTRARDAEELARGREYAQRGARLDYAGELPVEHVIRSHVEAAAIARAAYGRDTARLVVALCE